MTIRSILVLPALLLCAQGFAAEPTTGPLIEGYGASLVIEDADVALPANHEYKVVFELTGYDGQPDSLNRGLDRVARFMNLHAKNGVPAENIQSAVVLHGAALINALNDESYTRRFNVANPNLELLERLADAGVDFFVCGQSMGFREFGKNELAAPVKMAPSALTMVHLLQDEGFTLQP